MPDPTLQDAIKEAYASAPADEVILHTLEFSHASFSSPIRVVRDHNPISATLEGAYPGSYSYAWEFPNSVEGFSATNATLSVDATALKMTGTAGDPQIRTPGLLNLSGKEYPYIQARVRRVGGSGAWEGAAYYTTPGHGESGSYYKTATHPAPYALGEWAVVEWNMAALTAGGTDWVDSTINQIRFDLSHAAGETWEVDWVRVSSVPALGQTVEFTPFAFDFALPGSGATPSPEILITIDNVSREMMGYLDLAAQSATPIQVTYRPYLSSDLSTPQMVPPLTMFVREVSADVFRVTCRATFGDYANRKFPRQIYDAQRFPGLIAS